LYRGYGSYTGAFFWANAVFYRVDDDYEEKDFSAFLGFERMVRLSAYLSLKDSLTEDFSR
jgi:hypothetical protein